MGHDDSSGAYLIFFSATNRTRVVGTPTFIEDVDTYSSRLIDSASVVLPVDPTDMLFDKPSPFHDTIEPNASFSVMSLAWCLVQSRGPRARRRC